MRSLCRLARGDPAVLVTGIGPRTAKKLTDAPLRDIIIRDRASDGNLCRIRHAYHPVSSSRAPLARSFGAGGLPAAALPPHRRRRKGVGEE